ARHGGGGAQVVARQSERVVAVLVLVHDQGPAARRDVVAGGRGVALAAEAIDDTHRGEHGGAARRCQRAELGDNVRGRWGIPSSTSPTGASRSGAGCASATSPATPPTSSCRRRCRWAARSTSRPTKA